MSVFGTNISKAENDCVKVIDAADKAIKEQKTLIDLKTREIETQDRIIGAQDREIKDLEKKSSILYNPVTYVVLALGVGFFLGRR